MWSYLRSNSEISKQYVAPPFGRIFEDDLVSGRFVIDVVFCFWNRQDIRLFIISTSPARFWKVWSWLERLLSSCPAMRQKPCSEAMSLMCRRPPPLSVLLREKPWIWQGFLEQKIILGKVNGKRNGKPCVPNLAPKTIMEPEWRCVFSKSWFFRFHVNLLSLCTFQDVSNIYGLHEATGQKSSTCWDFYGGPNLVGPHNPPYLLLFEIRPAPQKEHSLPTTIFQEACHVSFRGLIKVPKKNWKENRTNYAVW